MWLDEQNNVTVTSEVKKAIDEWRSLQFEADAVQAQYEAKQQKADKAKAELCSLLRLNGLESMGLDDGTRIEVKEKVKCSVGKDSKAQVAQWLQEIGAGDLVAEQVIVMPSAIPVLQANHIGFDRDLNFNTNSIKAWVKGEMDRQHIRKEDLPKGLSWFQYDELVVKE